MKSSKQTFNLSGETDFTDIHVPPHMSNKCIMQINNIVLSIYDRLVYHWAVGFGLDQGWSVSPKRFTKFPQCNVNWNFQKYSVNFVYAIITWVFGNSEIMHCGILINMPCWFCYPRLVTQQWKWISYYYRFQSIVHVAWLHPRLPVSAV